MITVQQIVIGVAIGFVLQIVFDALAMGGQLLANTMGLSFAFNVDPLRGTGTPVLGQFYTLIATLTFLALNGHLAVIQALVDGFRTLPVGVDGLGPEGMWQVALWGGQLFRGALMVALPGLTALLIVNLAFGVVSRAAPSLNLFAIGFPGHADRRPADHPRGAAGGAVGLRRADGRGVRTSIGTLLRVGQLAPCQKPTNTTRQSNRHRSVWRMRGAMDAYLARGTSRPRR